MATVTETMGDASAGADTTYSMSPGDTFTGRLGERFDEDWVRVELQAGLTYEITLNGDGSDGAADTILRVYNSSGEQVAMNDDADPDAGNRFSMLEFTPESGGAYYIGAASYTANPNQENWGDYRVTVSNPGGSEPVKEDSDRVDEDTDSVDEDSVMEAVYYIVGGNDELREYFEGTIDDLRDGFILEIDGVYTVIRGGNGASRLTGSEEHDAIYAGAGADTIQGGAGHDIVLYVDSNTGVEVRLYDGAASGGHAEGDTFPGRRTIEYLDDTNATMQVEGLDIEALVGSAHDDILVGAEGEDLLLGGQGNDNLDGRESGDILDGMEGDDWLVGGPGLDLLIGGPGVDTVSYENERRAIVYLSTGEALVDGGDLDLFPGRQVIEYLDENGNSRQAEVSDIENLRGSHDRDQLTGTHGPNRLEGLGGNDSLIGLGGDDVLLGGAGNDNLQSGPGDDRVDGGAGNDYLEGGPGADQVRGGPGIDEASYWTSAAGVEVNLHTRALRGGDAEGDVFIGRETIEYVDAEGTARQAVVTDIENLYGSEADDILIGDARANELQGAAGNDVLEGREGDDYLTGDNYVFNGFYFYSTGGDDKLSGGAGDDWLVGGGGADELSGGPGVDTASYRRSGSAVGVGVLLYDGTAQGSEAEGDSFVGMKTIDYVDDEGNAQTVEVPDIENLFGSSGNDVLAGAHGPNRLDGHHGNDTLDGREGDDQLYGGEGADVLIGGPGADLLSGGPADEFFSTDTASYITSAAGVVVRLHAVLEHGARGGDAEGDIFAAETRTLTDDEGNAREVDVPDIEHLTGSEHDDTLAGDFRRNILWGEGGNDKLYGGPGGGDDVLFGDAGDDQVYGGKGHDRLYGGDGDDKVYGGNGRDWLYGGPGDDVLSGGPDNDVLDYAVYTVDLERSSATEIHFKTVRHDYGNDRLEGGAGDDYFYFYPDGGNDTILDFGNGEDRISLWALEDIQSVDDLTLQQQGDHLLIDLTAQGGGTITLQDYNQADISEDHFIFFVPEDSGTEA